MLALACAPSTAGGPGSEDLLLDNKPVPIPGVTIPGTYCALKVQRRAVDTPEGSASLYWVHYVFPLPTTYEQAEAERFSVVYAYAPAKPGEHAGSRRIGRAGYHVISHTWNPAQLHDRFRGDAKPVEEDGTPRAITHSGQGPQHSYAAFALRAAGANLSLDHGFGVEGSGVEGFGAEGAADGNAGGGAGRIPPGRLVVFARQQYCAYTLEEALKEVGISPFAEDRARLARFFGRGHYWLPGPPGWYPLPLEWLSAEGFIKFIATSSLSLEFRRKVERDADGNRIHSFEKAVWGRWYCWAYEPLTAGNGVPMKRQTQLRPMGDCENRGALPYNLFIDDVDTHPRPRDWFVLGPDGETRVSTLTIPRQPTRADGLASNFGRAAEEHEKTLVKLEEDDSPGIQLARIRPARHELDAARHPASELDFGFVIKASATDSLAAGRVLAECWGKDGQPLFWDYAPDHPDLPIHIKAALCYARWEYASQYERDIAR